MGGGPITGSATGIVIPTILQIAQDAVSYWTSMTCLYDPYWRETEKVTLPVCMFHMTGFTETWANETSRKRVILHEEPKTMQQMGETMRRSAMETIVDNIVKNPKTYSVEAIVPFLPIGRYVSSGVRGLTDTITTITELAANGDPSTRDAIINTVEGIFSVFGGMLKAGTDLLGLIDLVDGIGGSASTMNKNSLEAMADSGRVLCLKSWNGYDYKYVAITGMAIHKQPLEDDVFRASLQLQELPVLSVTEPNELKAKGIKHGVAETLAKELYGKLSAPITAFTGVQKADAGGPLRDAGSSLIDAVKAEE
jgi:hypothetical protein